MGDQAKVTLGDETVFLVPSGQGVTLQDIILDSPGPDGPVARFRFVAPQIARDLGRIDAETSGIDMHYLCETIVLQTLAKDGPLPSSVVVSMADRALEFGVANPDATQFFESFRIEGNKCVGELF